MTEAAGPVRSVLEGVLAALTAEHEAGTDETKPGLQLAYDLVEEVCAHVSDDRQLSLGEFATLAGAQPQSFHNYHAQGRLPEPDGKIGRTHWWWASTARRWLRERPYAHRKAKTDG